MTGRGKESKNGTTLFLPYCLFLVVGGWGGLKALRELPDSLEQGGWVGRDFQQVVVRRGGQIERMAARGNLVPAGCGVAEGSGEKTKR